MIRDDMVFYTHPWDGPTKVVVEYLGNLYDIREGWGCQEGWTNNHVALPLSDEESKQHGSDLIEMDEEEIGASFDEDTLEGIYTSVEEAYGTEARS